MAKQKIRLNASGKAEKNIQGRALPILVLVLSMRRPKNTSVMPSSSLLTAIRVPTMPTSSPT